MELSIYALLKSVVPIDDVKHDTSTSMIEDAVLGVLGHVQESMHV